MNKLKYMLMALLLGGATYSANAQSNNFNQYHLTPMYTSPAELGTSDYFQVLGHYRKQSLSQDQGYENFALSSTYPLYYKDGGRRFGGVGIAVMNESSGTMGMLQENSVRAGYAYNWQVTESHHVSFGLQGGYYRRNLDLGKVSTDEQYQNGTYVPGMASGENFSDNVSQAFKTDAGANWYVLDEYGDQKFSLGVAAFNINKANYEFLEVSQEQAAPIRYQAYGSVRALASGKVQLVPTFRYMVEKNYSQLNLGSLFLYQLQDGPAGMHESHLGLGAWYSLNNAAIFSLEYAQPSYILSLSYDLPASSNIDQMQVNNGVEVTFGWRLNKGKKRKAAMKAIPEVVEEKEPVRQEAPVAQKEPQPVESPMQPEQKETKPATGITRAGMENMQGTRYNLSPKEIKALENNVEFKVGSAALSTEAKSELENIVEVMKQHPEMKVKVVGHTCTLGTEKLNKRLSLDRAEAAKKDMISRGIDAGRIQVEGKDYKEPVASNDTEEGRMKNRRVEFIILDK